MLARHLSIYVLSPQTSFGPLFPQTFHCYPPTPRPLHHISFSLLICAPGPSAAVKNAPLIPHMHSCTSYIYTRHCARTAAPPPGSPAARRHVARGWIRVTPNYATGSPTAALRWVPRRTDNARAPCRLVHYSPAPPLDDRFASPGSVRSVSWIHCRLLRACACAPNAHAGSGRSVVPMPRFVGWLCRRRAPADIDLVLLVCTPLSHRTSPNRTRALDHHGPLGAYLVY